MVLKIKIDMKKTFMILMILISYSALSQNKWFEMYENAEIFRQDITDLIEDFEKQIKKIDSSLTLGDLDVVTQDSLAYGYYMPSENRIYFPMWPTAPQWAKNLFIQILGNEADETKLAELFFNGFYGPHEVAHSFQFENNLRQDNQYDNERMANEIALLYWRKKGYKKELEECHRMAKKMVGNLENPYPPNVDQKKYFTENYAAFIEDLPKYIYVQFDQLVEVFEDKTLPDFDTYIRQLLETSKKESNEKMD